MKVNEINWARQHDWYVSHDKVSITVMDGCEYKEFFNFKELYIWAGY